MAWEDQQNLDGRLVHINRCADPQCKMIHFAICDIEHNLLAQTILTDEVAHDVIARLQELLPKVS
jgi:hypothetical protein